MRKVTSDLLLTNYKSSFLSIPKDQETIWRKLLVESRPYSDKLKKLLIINTPNCLDPEQSQYQEIIDDYSIKRMMDMQYIKAVPKLSFGEHEEVKSYIMLEFDDFLPTQNPEYRDHIISFSIISHLDYWEMDDYQLRPWLIAGYIDGILHSSRFSGIGKLEFLGASQIVLNEYLGGVVLRYATVNGRDDEEKIREDMPSATTQITNGGV